MEGLKFEIVSVLGKLIRVSSEYWEFIVSVKHPAMLGREKLVERAISHADLVRQSKSDASVYLYYIAYNEYWLCAVCKHENGTGFLVTAYVTDRIKEGRLAWKRN